MPRRTRDQVPADDAAFFAGRAAELAVVDSFLDDASEARILLLSGVGGIGKSALLRETRRRAEAAGRSALSVDGRTVLTLDGRTLPLAIDLLRVALTPPADAVRPVILIDEAEAFGAGLAAVRELLLDVLPADARVVVAGRNRFDRTWLEGALDGLVLDLELRPLDERGARELLAGWGVLDPDQVAGVLPWAQGSPLALTIAAKTGARPGDAGSSEVGDRLIRELAAGEVEGVDADILDVAALTLAVDARLIAAALPGRNTRDAMTQLRALSLVEQVGDRAALHPVLADSLRRRMKDGRPEQYRRLRLRIADHLAARAVEEPQALFELTDLLEDPAVRAGAGLGASRTHYADGVRAGDLDTILRLVHADDSPWGAALLAAMRRYEASVTVVRRVDGEVAGAGLLVTADALDESALDDPLIGPLYAWARRIGDRPELTMIAPILLIRDDADDAEIAEIVRIGNTGGMARSRVADISRVYAQYGPGARVADEFLLRMGYRPIDALGRTIADVPVTVWETDFGGYGLVAFIHSMVAAELGGGSGPRGGRDLVAAIREFGDDAAMAARGPAGHDRKAAAETARALIRADLGALFDSSARDRRLLRALELAYLEPGLGESAALARLHVSRATYFRLLREGRHRVLMGGGFATPEPD